MPENEVKKLGMNQTVELVTGATITMGNTTLTVVEATADLKA